MNLRKNKEKYMSKTREKKRKKQYNHIIISKMKKKCRKTQELSDAPTIISWLGHCGFSPKP